MKKTGLIFYYNPQNRNGFNALASALEIDKFFRDLEIVFAVDEPDLLAKTEGLCEKNDKIVVCFSFFSNQIENIKKITKKLRERFKKKVLIVAGGPHPTGNIKETLGMGFDFALKGEAEKTFPLLLKRIMRKEKPKKTENKFKPIDINDYPAVSVKYDTLGSIEITRGCPFACSYCQTSHIFGKKVRHRSIKNILDAAKAIKKRYKGQKNIYFRFISPDAFAYGSKDGRKINIGSLEKLLSGLRKIAGREIKIFFGTFPSEVRPEHVTKETIGLILKYCDNDNLIIGAQTGSPQMLKACRRGHTIEDVYSAVKLIKGAGLTANVDFIFGLPGETKKDAELTVETMENLIKMGARIHGHLFTPLPQTAFRNKPAGKIHSVIQNFLNKYKPKNVVYGNIK